MVWCAFDNLKPYPPIPGGDGEIPEEFLNYVQNHVNNDTIHVTQELIDKINESVSIVDVDGKFTKDIVFKLVEPIYEGIQEETEFLYPFKGTIESVDTYITLDSEPTSNLIMTLQMYVNNNWTVISTIHIMHLGQKSVHLDTNIEINNNRLRVAILNGDVENVTGMGMIVRVNTDN